MTPEAWILAFIAAAMCGIGGAIEKKLASILKALQAVEREQEAARHAIGRLDLRIGSSSRGESE